MVMAPKARRFSTNRQGRFAGVKLLVGADVSGASAEAQVDLCTFPDAGVP